jgi:hypothetical protein
LLQWYKQAADQGYASAMYSLAGLYQDGEGTEVNPPEAGKWLAKAAMKPPGSGPRVAVPTLRWLPRLHHRYRSSGGDDGNTFKAIEDQ